MQRVLQKVRLDPCTVGLINLQVTIKNTVNAPYAASNAVNACHDFRAGVFLEYLQRIGGRGNAGQRGLDLMGDHGNEVRLVLARSDFALGPYLGSLRLLDDLLVHHLLGTHTGTDDQMQGNNIADGADQEGVKDDEVTREETQHLRRRSPDGTDANRGCRDENDPACSLVAKQLNTAPKRDRCHQGGVAQHNALRFREIPQRNGHQQE